MLRIFISYAFEDSPLTRRLARDLEKHGHRVWFAEKDIYIGDDFPTEVSDAIDDSDIMIALLSPSSVDSRWPPHEWSIGIGRQLGDERLRILPVIGTPCDVPTLLSPLHQANVHRDYPSGLKALLESIRRIEGRHDMRSDESRGGAKMARKHDASDRGERQEPAISLQGIAEGFLMAARKNPVRLLLLGRTGVGKSSTINALFDEGVAEIDEFEPATSDVREYNKVIEGVAITVTDTPGLCDDLPESGNDRRYLELLRSKQRHFDCVLFVTTLDAPRISGDERRALQLLTKTFGAKLWEHAVIVLTRGDAVGSENLSRTRERRTELLRAEISRHAGGKALPAIPSVVTSNVNQRLPDGSEWLPELFTQVFARMSDAAGRSFLVSNARRLRTKPKGARSKPGIASPPRGRREIILTDEQAATVRKKATRSFPGFALSGAAIGTAIAGPAGTVPGALIGGVIDLLRWLAK